MLRQFARAVALAFILTICLPLPAVAVQTHGGAEGLVSHQIGHILFFSGMLFLLLHLARLGVHATGWPEFKLFLWFIIAWNCLTFTGHLMREYVPPERFIRAGGQTVAYVAGGFWDILFYVSNLDHLLLVPSFFFLLVALNKWSRTT